MSTDWEVWDTYERDSPGHVHIIPADDALPHSLKDGCHCMPECRELKYSSRPIYVHHAFDCRETEDAETLM